ncbi:hypothetical protein N0V84_001929 [Fusarium piperis]|uniref:Uncharacterized protein n=1 Tax=Fusarium piperis TaxID=1435070 RepID=A0A9W9BTW3_9HYPO|nr:hypothetical protein N0V84_001929 [Fusarium piperis]
MTPDRPLGEIALNPNRVTLPPPFKTADARPDATTETATGARRGGDPTDALSRVSHQIASTRPTAPAAAASIAKPPPVKAVVAAAAVTAMQRNPSLDRDDGSTQSHPLSTAGSQDTNMTTSTDPAFTPPASDAGTCAPGPSSQDSQLLQLSEIAAAQDRMDTEAWSSRKRMADGEVKSRRDSQSPVKGHSRNPSAVSRTSATGGYIGELSAELKTRLSYAMIKHLHRPPPPGFLGKSSNTPQRRALLLGSSTARFCSPASKIQFTSKILIT